MKGERCLSPKCAMVERPYNPGHKGKRRGRALSEYGKELREKQRLRNWYNLKEGQFKKYVKNTLSQKGKIEDAAEFLIQKLENRLDNVVYRAGLAVSRQQARQMVSHGHFLVNNKKVDVPSYGARKGDIISLRAASQKKNIFQGIQAKLKKYKPPNWLSLDADRVEVKVVGLPTLEEAAPPAEISTIFEFYSR
mgnify:CR=1 FL=1